MMGEGNLVGLNLMSNGQPMSDDGWGGGTYATTTRCRLCEAVWS